MANRSLLVGGAGSSAPRAHDHGGVVNITKVVRGADQSLPNATHTAISWGGEFWDHDGMWSAGTDLTVVTPGLWELIAVVGFATNGNGERNATIRANGTPVTGANGYAVTEIRPIVPDATYCHVTAVAALVAGDVLTVTGKQTSGGALNAGGEFTAIYRGTAP